MNFFYSLGQVVFIAGGHDQNYPVSSVILYSPGGLCNYNLASLPQALYDISLSFLNGRITSCGGYNQGGTTKCWKYNIRYNEWTELTASKYQHNLQPSQVYNNKLYYLNTANQSEVYDPELNVWTQWLPPPVYAGERPCLVTWKDSFILIGGSSNSRGVQLYNITRNQWSTLSIMPPISRVGYSCAQLPKKPNKFLILGGEAEKQHAAIYDASTDYWTTAAKSNLVRHYSSLSVLGNKVFAIGGLGDARKQIDTVEEYLISQDKWETKGVKLVPARHAFASLTIPADLFDSANLYTPFDEGCVSI